MRMKERFWPFEQERRPSPVLQAIKVGLREAKRELTKQQRAQKVRGLPDPFSNK